MKGRLEDILDDGLRRKFGSFCLTWGVLPDGLEGEEYMKMIELYYKEVSISMLCHPPIVNVPVDLRSVPRG
jgi:hypothetical protein